MILGGTCCAVAGYALVLWLPAFFVRAHDLGTGVVGSAFALIAGVGGGLGVYGTGWLADRLARYGEGWRMRILAIGLLLAAPLLILTVTVENATLAFAAYTLPAIVGAFQVGPCFAMIQARTPLESRAVAASINLFVGNIIGLGLGPLCVGLISDALQPRLGADSLAFALGALVLIYALGAGLFLLAARRIDAEARS